MLKIIPFDKRNAGACPGCGMFDNGNHIGHRYSTMDWLNDSEYKAYKDGTASKGVIREVEASLKRVAKFHSWCARELGL